MPVAILPALLDKAPHFDVVLTMYNFTMGPELGAAIDSAPEPAWELLR